MLLVEMLISDIKNNNNNIKNIMNLIVTIMKAIFVVKSKVNFTVCGTVMLVRHCITDNLVEISRAFPRPFIY